jgi:hypothetical protein
MERLKTAALLLVIFTTPAYAGGPTQGTYAGDRTVGSSISNYAKTNGGMSSWTADRTPGKSSELPGEVAEDITGHISDPNVVGNAPHNDPGNK